MRVKMLKTFRIAPDGIRLETAYEGQLMELPLELAKALIRDKFAVEYKEQVVPPASTPNDNKTDDTKSDDTKVDDKKDSKSDNKKSDSQDTKKG